MSGRVASGRIVSALFPAVRDRKTLLHEHKEGLKHVNSTYGFVNVGCALFGVHVADPAANVAEMTALLEQARDEAVDVLVFPELALTGYTCGDLFAQASLVRRAEEGLARLMHSAARICPESIFCAGLPVLQDGILFNAAALVQGGQLLGVVPKTFVPNSQEFYEKRWFAPSWARTRDTVTLCGQTVPCTPDLLVCVPGGPVIGCEICEDLWVQEPPSGHLAAQGATLILNPSASNEVATKSRYRRDLVRLQSGRLLCAYAYASSGPGESTTDLVFSGHCLIAAGGLISAESREKAGITQALIDLERLTNDRLKQTSAFQIPGALRKGDVVRVQAQSLAETGILPDSVDPAPFVPRGEELSSRCQEILHLQSRGLAQRMAKTGCKCLVLGISGGLDSTLALLVAADACDSLGLPRSSIHAVTMPGFGTTDHTRTNALRLMELLGVQARTIDIRPACLQHFKDIGQPADCYDVTFENAQARERTQILMDLANREGGLVVGTGDMSELALGWATYNGDHMSMYAVNCGVPKTLVRFLVEEYATLHAEVAEVLHSVCATEISPELLPPDAAGNRQSTEGTIGKYVLHDFFLYHFVRNGFAREKIRALARIAFPGEEETVDRTLEVFFSRFFSQQFKRSCLPDGPKVGTVSLSPRGDWRMPSDVRCSY